MIPIKKEYIHQNSIAIISISLLGILIIGSLLTLLFIKRSQAHTNLLELSNPSNSNTQSINNIKVLPQNIKSTSINPSQPKHLTILKEIKTTK
jgi:hypothetical protein